MTLALNKATLKRQRDQAKLYRRFLPSLELKRQQLQVAWRASKTELVEIQAEVRRVHENLQTLYPLIGASSIDITEMASWVRIAAIELGRENVVGTTVPVLGELRLEVDRLLAAGDAFLGGFAGRGVEANVGIASSGRRCPAANREARESLAEGHAAGEPVRKGTHTEGRAKHSPHRHFFVRPGACGGRSVQNRQIQVARGLKNWPLFPLNA